MAAQLVIGCSDANTAKVAEGCPPDVDIRVDYEAADLANGRDTVLEAAASALRD